MGETKTEMKNTAKPPADLSDAGKKLWKQIFAEIEIDAAGALLLDTLVRSFDRMMEARAAIAKDGCVVVGRYGPKASPWAQIERDAAATLTRCWRLLVPNCKTKRIMA